MGISIGAREGWMGGTLYITALGHDPRCEAFLSFYVAQSQKTDIFGSIENLLLKFDLKRFF